MLMGEAGRGWARSQIILTQESLALYKLCNILWLAGSERDQNYLKTAQGPLCVQSDTLLFEP